MAFFKVRTDEEYIADSDGNGGKYIIKSGMYEVKVLHCCLVKSEKGSESLDLIVEHDGVEQTIYRAFGMTNNDGSANFGQQLFNKLCIVAGGEQAGFEISDPVTKSVRVSVKNNEYKEMQCLEDFEGIEVCLRMQRQYSKYNGEIQGRTVIKNVFRLPDHASASEIINKVEPKGQQYEKELEQAEKNAYRDGVTPEQAETYEKSRLNKDKATAEPAAKPVNRFSSLRAKPSEAVETDDVPF